MTGKLAALIERTGLALLDGGLATELEARGHDLDDPLWSAKILLEAPEAIAEVHRSYLQAGADIVTTATYQATFEGLARRGLDHEAAARLMISAVDLARDVSSRHQQHSGREALVAASVGSFGAYLTDGSEYRGDYGLSVNELARFHRDRLRLLAQHADVLACETIPCLAEVQALAQEIAALEHTEAWVSLSCKDEHAVWHGESVQDCVMALRDVSQVSAVGINCVTPSIVLPLLARIRSVWDRILVVYPNSGEAWDRGWQGAATGPERFAELAASWAAAGARVIGGCCRTGPRHIAAIAAWRDAVLRAGAQP